ncbi:MAG: NADH-quinone oxidoreductase subunit C [Actinomycetota bacterium]|nr:NADH-quinone oxidoreductase subunit C [Actinomycetota bacterium]MDK1026960.1 NADH-quinone oxidoreductase subunit C [Actinomycetota bacterium]MDK1038317.1 NADH-quinone oxidoreductase subunit C [Actinomycetota bacterium]MDK1102991.1 NADH-quinone oxidoreductase subunit C [Actinomycetota bacterium]
MNELIATLVEPFDAAEVELRSYASSETTYHAITIPVSDWVDFALHAHEIGFDTFIDLFAVDHFTEAPRFEVTLNLLSMTAKERILVSTRVPYDGATVPTITDVFQGANFYEREAYDLLGVDFPGHPDLTRILMPDDWVGHPLRKDYDIGEVPVEFKAGSADL